MEEKRSRSDASSHAESDSARTKESGREKSSAKSSYENIPLQGTHRGEVDDPLTSSVRAQEPAAPTAPAQPIEDEPSDEESTGAAPGDLRTYQLSEDPASGRHRVRVLPRGEASAASGGGFKEISRYSSEEALSEALRTDLPDGPRFVVLENTATGEVYFDREINVSDARGDEFDQMTIFTDENEAAAYADERQHGD